MRGSTGIEIGRDRLTGRRLAERLDEPGLGRLGVEAVLLRDHAGIAGKPRDGLGGDRRLPREGVESGAGGDSVEGDEMARVIEAQDGPEGVVRAAWGGPIEFFSRYVDISHTHPENVRYRFDAETERIVESMAHPPRR